MFTSKITKQTFDLYFPKNITQPKEKNYLCFLVFNLTLSIRCVIIQMLYMQRGGMHCYSCLFIVRFRKHPPTFAYNLYFFKETAVRRTSFGTRNFL